MARGDDRQDKQIAQAIDDRFMDDGNLDGTEIQVQVNASEAP